MLAIHCYGRALGVDALMNVSQASRARTTAIGRLLAAAG